jgi:hypothetical protein
MTMFIHLLTLPSNPIGFGLKKDFFKNQQAYSQGGGQEIS